jgi:hypothetical protein
MTELFDQTPADGGGLLEVRNPVFPDASLQDPRVPTWGDRVAAQRRLLMGAFKPKKSAVAARPLERAEDPTGSAVATKALGLAEDLTGQVYRYTRGNDLTNDEMGYGERADEVFWEVSGKKLVPRLRTSQRTKSGRQVLKKVLKK